METRDLFTNLPLIETARVRLRPMRMADDTEVFAYVRDPEVSRYVEWEPHTSIGHSRAYIRAVEQWAKDGTARTWAVQHQQDGRMIGAFALSSWKPAHQSAASAT